jgi:hypothetical protein
MKELPATTHHVGHDMALPEPLSPARRHLNLVGSWATWRSMR